MHREYFVQYTYLVLAKFPTGHHGILGFISSRTTYLKGDTVPLYLTLFR
jgi:hypothetical protein